MVQLFLKFISANEGVDNSLLTIDQNIDHLRYNIELISTLSAMMDCFGQSVLQNTPRIVAFIKNILDLSQQQGEDDGSKASAKEGKNLLNNGGTVDLALMLLSTLLASNQVHAL